ncbi:hypothetical protein CRUP_022402 [Coryphaenoides rupestris]|nr:hypothetical protein CRUP_022402 [Coryphaenoides rupestris]
MSPVSQSQFIPLAEVLCSAISDMNSSQTTDIVHNALGSMIKERKVYHTGDGYFIVTPQTYFITNSLVREKTWWASPAGDRPPSPPPITYLLSNEVCDPDAAHDPPVAHCRSCSCFSPPQVPSNNRTPPPVAPPTAPPSAPPAAVPDGHSVSVSECTGKSLKWPRPSDHKPTLVHQSTSTAADYQHSELSKTTGTTNATSRKDKDSKDNKSGRKFGLSLFWRNGGKKEKLKKEFASFSGQFPPEEWPVRDEEDLNNLPRDLEHAIIKRINPELTVDNLTRHTVLMKKLDDRGERGVDMVQERVVDKGERVDRGVDKGERVDRGVDKGERVDRGMDKGERVDRGVDKGRGERVDRGVDKGERVDRGVDKGERVDRGVDKGERVDRGVDKGERVDRGVDKGERVDRGVDKGERVDRGVDKGERVDRGVDKGISTEILTVSKPRHHQSSRGAGRRSAPKAPRSKRRPYSSREKNREREKERSRNKTHTCEEENPEEEDLFPSQLQPDVPEHQEEAGDQRYVYKKRIENPFHRQPTTDTAAPAALTAQRVVANSRGHRRREAKDSRTSVAGRKERMGLRSKSWDPHRTKVIVPETWHRSSAPDDRYAPLHERRLAADDILRPDIKPGRELPSAYGGAYPQSGTLRMDDKLKHQAGPGAADPGAPEDQPRPLQEPQGRGSTDLRRHEMEQATEVANFSPYSDADVILTLTPTHPYDSCVEATRDRVMPWTTANASVQQRHSLRHAEEQEDKLKPDLLHSHQQPGDFTAKRRQAVAEAAVPGCANRAEPFGRPELVALPANSQDFIEDDQRLYEEEEEDEDTCSSLYLNEEEVIDDAPYVHGHHAGYSDYRSDMRYHGPRGQPHNPPRCPAQAPPSLQEDRDGSTAATRRENSRSHHHHSQSCRSPGLQSETGPRRAAMPRGEAHRGSTATLLETPEATDGSIFDYCPASEVDSDAETVRRSVGDGDGESAHWRVELEEEAEQRLERLAEDRTPQRHAVGLSMPSGARAGVGGTGETAESQSITGDSGIDSPRTCVSLASNNTVILQGLKKRGFLQNLENLRSKSSTMRPQSSLLQLTPVMNV